MDQATVDLHDLDHSVDRVVAASAVDLNRKYFTDTNFGGLGHVHNCQLLVAENELDLRFDVEGLLRLWSLASYLSLLGLIVVNDDRSRS